MAVASPPTAASTAGPSKGLHTGQTEHLPKKIEISAIGKDGGVREGDSADVEASQYIVTAAKEEKDAWR